MLVPSPESNVPPTDLNRLLGTMITSLAKMGISSFLPFITDAISTFISCLLLVTGSSRNINPLPAAALNVVPCASDIACLSVVPSLNGKDPGAWILAGDEEHVGWRYIDDATRFDVHIFIEVPSK